MTTYCINPEKADNLDMNLPISVSWGRYREEKEWKRRDGSIHQFMKLFETHRVGKKDGPAITQGWLSGGQRIARNVVANTVLMLDLDTGEEVESVLEKIEDKGLFAILWTTYSHMKDATDLNEGKLLQWMKKNKRSGSGAMEDIQAYYTDGNKLQPHIINSMVSEGKSHRDGGIAFVIRHKPIPKLRVLFVLDEPFHFGTEGRTQVERIDDWRKFYVGVSDWLGVTYDKSCVDPSRLMYLPARSEDDQLYDDGGHHETLWLRGRALRLTDVAVQETPSSTKTSNPSSIRRSLREFLAGQGRNFDAALFMEAHEPDGVRNAINGGYEFRCPNALGHTDGDVDTDRAFMVLNASENPIGDVWHMGCQHATCKAESGGDRAWYLQRFAENNDLSIDDMEVYCYETLESEEATEGSERNTAVVVEESALMSLDDAVARLHASDMRDMSEDDRKLVLSALVEYAESDDVGTVMRASSLIEQKATRKVLGFEKASAYRAALDAVRRTLRTRKRAAKKAREKGENEMQIIADAAADEVWEHWPFLDQCAKVVKILTTKNATDPDLFNAPDGRTVSVYANGTQTIQAQVYDADWVYWIGRLCVFKKQLNNGAIRIISVPRDLVSHVRVMMTREIYFPILERVTSVPLFAADGSLRTTEGYDAASRTYLRPSCDFIPVPDVPDEEDVDEAMELLYGNALRDFPFSDNFGGVDHSPIKLDELDEDGYTRPNMERGKSSRAHALAMILQPFVRAMIGGNTPAYHLDKAAPGTGASYLADISATILTGYGAETLSLSKGDTGETRKLITSNVITGTPIMFFDNINHKVDSSDLALALTAGRWSDRLLGKSEMFTAKINSLWVFAGNNLAFSHELYRRLVPIRMDAATPNPAKDRGVRDFKHFPLQRYLSANRSQLVWACHVLVQNWIAKGQPKGSYEMNSFEEWSHTMGGILECAGVDGFGAGIGSYNSAQNQDEDIAVRVIADAFALFKSAKFTARELFLGVLVSPYSANAERPDLVYDLGLEGSSSSYLVRSLAWWIKRDVVGRVFVIDAKTSVAVDAVKARGELQYVIQMVESK